MSSITIGLNTFDVYADVAEADDYMAGELDSAAWDAATSVTNKKAKALITATRLIDRSAWAGVRTDTDQPHAFPRASTGVSDLDDDTVPTDIVEGSILIANALIEGVDLVGSQSTSSNIKRQAAGSVSIEYFRPFDSLRFPVNVMELLRRYIGVGTVAVGAMAFGTDGCSIIEINHDECAFAPSVYTLNRSY